MKELIKITCLTLMFALTCTLTGCGGEDGGGGDNGGGAGDSGGASGVTVTVDETKPVADLQAMAAKMSESDLKAAATKYFEALTAKKAELDKVMGDLKSQLTGGSAEPGADMAALSNSVKALTERLAVFVEKLKEKGVDVSEFAS